MKINNLRKSEVSDVDELWKAFKRSGSEKAREELILNYVHLVKYSAGRIAVSLPNHIDINDLFAAGLLGLIQALEKFDENRNTKYETYAISRIRGAMLDELRNQDWFPRSIRHKAKLLESVLSDLEAKLGRAPTDSDVVDHLKISHKEYCRMLSDVSLTTLISLDQGITSNHEGLYSIIGDSLPHANAIDPYAKMEEKEFLEIIKSMLESLPEKETLVLTLYYYEELTLKEIGEVLEVSESRICQIHTKAMLRLKGRINRLMNGLYSGGSRKNSKECPVVEKSGRVLRKKVSRSAAG